MVKKIKRIIKVYQNTGISLYIGKDSKAQNRGTFSKDAYKVNSPIKILFST